MGIERRHFTRIHFDMPARLAVAGSDSEVKLLDISFNGALVDVRSGLLPRVGSPCELKLQLASANVHDRIAMSAEVAHVEGSHIGLMCRSIDLDSMTHLRQLIELNLGDPQLLDRELKALVSSG